MTTRGTFLLGLLALWAELQAAPITGKYGLGTPSLSRSQEYFLHFRGIVDWFGLEGTLKAHVVQALP